MTPLHTQILTARDRNGQELRTIQKQLQKLPPGKLICSRNGTTVKWYQGDGHSKTYIPKANRTLAEQLALKKYLQQQEQILLQEQAAITAYLKYSPAGSLSSDDPHLLSDPACEDLLRSYFSMMHDSLAAAGIRALAPFGREVIAARNCHKAVYHAIPLSLTLNG